MKNFLKKNYIYLIFSFVVVIFTVVAGFGVGNTLAPSTYLQTGNYDVITGYNAVAFEIDYGKNKNGETEKLDSVYINFASKDFDKKAEEKISVRSLLASSESNSFLQVSNFTVENSYSKLKVGSWVKICSSENLDTGTVSSRPIFLLAIPFDISIKINEIVFVGIAGEELSILSAEPLRCGIKDNLTTSLNGSNEFQSNKNAIALANSLIDESGKFDLGRIVDGQYVNDVNSYFTEAEAYTVEGVRNVLSGNGVFVDNTVNPLSAFVLGIGTSIFGYTTLGLRIMPLLFTIATGVVLFFFGSYLFKKKIYGLIFASLFFLGGYSMAFATFGAIDSAFAMFIVLSVWMILRFYRKGVGNKNPAKGLANILLSGLFISIAFALKSQAIYFAIVLLVLFINGLIRQYKAHLYRCVVNCDNDKQLLKKEHTIYKRKVTITVASAVIGYIVLPIILILLTYFPAVNAYSQAFGRSNLFSYAWASIKNTFTAVNQTSYSVANLGSALGWPINHSAQFISDNKAIFGNLILSFINVFSLLYFTCCAVLSVGDKDKKAKDYKNKLYLPLAIFGLGFLFGWLLHLIGNSGIGGYYVPQIFATGISVALFKYLLEENAKLTVKIGKASVPVVKGVYMAMLIAIVVAFVTAVPMLIGGNTLGYISYWQMF